MARSVIFSAFGLGRRLHKSTRGYFLPGKRGILLNAGALGKKLRLRQLDQE